MASTDYDFKFKILVLGDAGAGKTAIARRFALDTFSVDYMHTIGIDYLENIIVTDGKRIKMQLWDTAGQERYLYCPDQSNL